MCITLSVDFSIYTISPDLMFVHAWNKKRFLDLMSPDEAFGRDFLQICGHSPQYPERQVWVEDIYAVNGFLFQGKTRPTVRDRKSALSV